MLTCRPIFKTGKDKVKGKNQRKALHVPKFRSLLHLIFFLSLCITEIVDLLAPIKLNSQKAKRINAFVAKVGKRYR